MRLKLLSDNEFPALCRCGPNEQAMAGNRKNYLSVGSQTGGKSAANADTLIETAKLNGVDPQA
jgi:hypothetical protein